jgi:RNA polymerase sigma-70 factor (ECF subfamily)
LARSSLYLSERELLKDSLMPTESELIKQAVKRDAPAFGELYQLHLRQIYRYIFYKVGNPSEAEDLTEQVFLKAWEAMPRYREQGVPFAAWLFRLAHNTVIDYHRTKHEAVALDELIDAEDGQASPEDVTSTRLDVQTLQTAITRLTPEQQQVVILRFVQGLSHGEVAAIMGKNEGAIRGLQHRALEALHGLLADRIGAL